ncbi:hypothetical protein [Sporomusa acidovorans]|nr:hypothetical protein [Sporomusa acidovorans]
MTEDEICERIWEICTALQYFPEKIAEKELMQELDALCNLMIQRHNSIVRTAP